MHTGTCFHQKKTLSHQGSSEKRRNELKIAPNYTVQRSSFAIIRTDPN